MASRNQILPRKFQLERYFAKYEFNTKYLICVSDAEGLEMRDVINMADDECKALWEHLKLCYTESTGHPLLRQEVAKLHDVTGEQVLIITPQEGIYIAMHCLVDYLKKSHTKDRIHAVATFPAYQSLYENLATVGCEVDEWTVRYTEQGWQFSLEELKALLKEDTKLLVVNFPHNPTGYIPNEEMWNDIIELCRSRGIFLFSDEMYRLSNNDGSAPLPSACALYHNAITLFGMSKTLALPGLRIGWLCTKNDDVMAMMQSFKDYITICSSAPSEILSLIALRNKDQIVGRTVGIVKKNLEHMEDFMKDFSDIFDWKRPRACTTGFLRLKGWSLELGSGGATGFSETVLQACGVLCLPSAMYEFPDEYIRIGLGRQNFPEALGVLRNFLESRTKLNVCT